MPLGVCLVDVQGKIIYWNAAAEGITGYLAPEVLGRAYRGDLLIHGGAGNAITEVQCPVMEVLRDGRPVTGELFLRHKDGHRTPIHVFAFPLRDWTGEMRGVGEIFDPLAGKTGSHGLGRALGPRVRDGDRTACRGGEPGSTCRPCFVHGRRPSSALMLIEMSEQHAILQHGGTAMLHQAIRVLAKTVAGLLPPRHYVGCWSDWRLIAIVPECKAETLEELKSTTGRRGFVLRREVVGRSRGGGDARGGAPWWTHRKPWMR